MSTTTAHPYRIPQRPNAARARFWPSFGLAHVVATIALAVPIAWAARSEGHTASTVTCSTVTENDWAAPCLVHDAHTVAAAERVPCSDAPAALETLMDSRNPLSRPFVTAMITESPAAPDTMVVPAKGVMVNGAPMAVIKRVKHDETKAAALPPLAKPAVDSSGGISPTDARALLSSCVARSGAAAGGPTQTMALAIMERDYTTSAFVLAGAVVLSILLSLRRRVGVTLDGAGGVTVLERGFFRVRSCASFAVADVADVRVASGASGLFAASRVEIVKRDGDTVPLTQSFVALSSGKCRRTAAALRTLLGAAT
jgi:hypothetical protein